jgi:hypothetical protein
MSLLLCPFYLTTQTNKRNMSLKCPKCGLYNPETALVCDCGFTFIKAEIIWNVQTGLSVEDEKRGEFIRDKVMRGYKLAEAKKLWEEQLKAEQPFQDLESTKTKKSQADFIKEKLAEGKTLPEIKEMWAEHIYNGSKNLNESLCSTLPVPESEFSFIRRMKKEGKTLEEARTLWRGKASTEPLKSVTQDDATVNQKSTKKIALVKQKTVIFSLVIVSIVVLVLIAKGYFFSTAEDFDSTFVIKVIPSSKDDLYDIQYEIKRKDGTIIIKDLKSQEGYNAYEANGKKLSVTISQGYDDQNIKLEIWEKLSLKLNDELKGAGKLTLKTE